MSKVAAKDRLKRKRIIPAPFVAQRTLRLPICNQTKSTRCSDAVPPKKAELGTTMDDSALKEFTNVDAEDPSNALGDLNSEEVADVGLKINVNKIKKDDP